MQLYSKIQRINTYQTQQKTDRLFEEGHHEADQAHATVDSDDPINTVASSKKTPIISIASAVLNFVLNHFFFLQRQGPRPKTGQS